MMNPILSTASVLLFAVSAIAQAPVDDIGLTVNTANGRQLGQQCGRVGCQPVASTPAQVGLSLTFGHDSRAQTPYLLALGLPGGCTAIPGIANSVLLDLNATVIISFGMTSAPPFVPLPCGQGSAAVTFPIPANAPLGLVFRVQGVGQSVASNDFAFGPTLEFTVQ